MFHYVYAGLYPKNGLPNGIQQAHRGILWLLYIRVGIMAEDMSVIPPSIRRPTDDELREKAAKHFIDLSEEEFQDFSAILDKWLLAYERLDDLPESRAPVTVTQRDPGNRPSTEEDPFNAIVTTCSVRGADEGPLAGMEVGLKDNIALAGVEMTCGSRVFSGYVPQNDATIVSRLLEAGADMTAKLTMEAWAVSSTGDQSATGPVLNPHDTNYLAGGSSSGSAVAVVNRDVDLAIGTDQAGSIRMPAALCGCVGLKPTFGLVPYTGIVAVSPTVDHVGPMTRSVADSARALEVLAGRDPLDHRQGPVEDADYVEACSMRPTEVTVGILEEGFGVDGGDKRVDDVAHESLEAFAEAGAEIKDLSIPWHRDGTAIRNAVVNEAHTALVNGEGVGHFLDGWYDSNFAEAFGRARRVHGNDFPIMFKLRLIIGQYLSDEYLGHYHAKAQNLSRELTEAYDEALSKVDVLALPTTPRTALEHRPEVTRREYVDRALGLISNTAPFNVTGHPAISVPCGSIDSLPVGMMFVGDRFDDATVLGVSSAFETCVG